ncbi:MAG: beta-ketoacyl-ACP synthase II [Bacteroidales bacterium]|nr:beta-ketoacyl-ACP synthase II [Bacteroidales bacterium]
MELKRVVITGIGGFTPIGNSIEEIYKNLQAGTSGSGPITRFDASNCKTQFACEVKNFDPTLLMDRKEARKMDLFEQFAIAATTQCFEDSKLDLANTDLDRIGVIWGTGIGGLSSYEPEVRDFYLSGTGIPRFSPFTIPKLIPNMAAGQISIKFGLRGISHSVSSACASSSHAIIDAINYIRLGKCDMLISGGSEAPINISAIGGFNAMKALSENNAEMMTASRPFDATRDGFVMAEGGVALLLEELEHAKNRGAKIYAEIVGCGLTSDAYHLTAPHPEGRGTINVMKYALEDANIKPSDIDYINVHGTSTPIGDIIELTSIQKLFGDDVYKTNISSTKSMTGHMLGATGAMEAVASIFAIQTGIIPPTINFKQLDEKIDSKLNLTTNEAQQRDVKYALSNNFGFGGHNSTIIFKKYSE